MGFSKKCFAAIAFCLTSMAAQSFGELIMLRHPPTKIGSERILTCVSDDDGAALIWNYNPGSNETYDTRRDLFTNFEPKKPTSKNVRACAIWDSTTCFARWGNISGWDAVDTTSRPMGPVLDYRWEAIEYIHCVDDYLGILGFKEFVSEQIIEQQKYQYVGKIDEFSGTAVFSVRGPRDANVFLCESSDPTKGLCFRITLGGSKGRRSAIWICPKGAPEVNQSKKEKNCKELHNYKHGFEDVVHPYEWRTFTLNWNRHNKTVQVFKHRANQPFLKGRVEHWSNVVSHVSIRSEITTRFRFHFYEYLLTKKRDSLLYTREFDQRNEDFCIELPVGLCSECELNLSLVDSTNGRSLSAKNISCGKKPAHNGLLTWRLAKLSANVSSKSLRLEIRTILKKDDGDAQWAIDSFRTCEPAGGLRESTITVHGDMLSGSPVWPRVKCQKISYTDSATVNSHSRSATSHSTGQLQQLLRRYLKSCASSCTGFGVESSICNPEGCICDRGFKGKDCNEGCTSGYHGYNCNEKCGSCDNGFCDTKTGYCRAGCENKKLLPPLCGKELGRPTVVDVADTTARALQYVELGAGLEASLLLAIEGWNEQCVEFAQPKPETPSTYEANITNLQPNTSYNVHTIVSMKIEGNTVDIHGPKESFTTLSREEPRPVLTPDIQSLEVSFTSDAKVTLRWKPPLSENGGNVEYDVQVKRGTLLGCEDLGIPTPLEQTIAQTVNTTTVSFDLHPYANYTSTVRARTTIDGNPETITFQTPAAAIPTSKVSNFRIAKKNTILEWDKPADCSTITGPTNTTRLIFASVNDSVRNWTATEQTTRLYFRLTEDKLKLLPYTRYRVRAYVIRGYDLPENSTSYQELTWRTPPIEPTAVKNLEIYEADPKTKTISLRWLPPDPANGEIEFYRVSIKRKNKSVHRSDTVKVSKAASNCDKQENYLCYKNLELPPDFSANDTEIEVYAKNEDVEKAGASRTILFVRESYFKVPSQPLSLTATSEAHGIVKLTWTHPSVSYEKIVRFLIRIEVLETKLWENVTARFPTTREYPASEKQENYTARLYLPTSTAYRVSVTAVDSTNSNSSQAQVDISVGEGVAFAGGRELQITQDGTLINVMVPRVVNATRKTMVSVKVKGSLTCTWKHPRRSSSPSNPTEVIAVEYKPRRNEAENLTIDANNIDTDASDCSLDLGETYEITAVVEDAYSGMSANLAASELVLKAGNARNLAWLISFPIIALCVYSFIRYRKRKRVSVREPHSEIFLLSEMETDTKSSTENLTTSCNRQNSTPPLDDPKVKRTLSHDYAVPFANASNSVSMICFEEYTREAVASGLLNSQYAMFPRGLTRPCEYGRLPQNMPKNRNENLIAYDDTRVILDKIPGDPYSDYINASYIQGYGKEAGYIATQGPKPNTINDFWRMIWQKRVRVICMLTNLTENGQTTCERYWPEVGTEGRYGGFTVSNTNHQVFADYTFRTIGLSDETETRTVTHLHYTGWPDNGVPMYSQSLVAYLKKLVETLDGQGPVVIHCSEGDGRTGTIILCDICVRHAIVEREIEVPAVTKRMYDSRANMLDNPQQYLLAHVVIKESVMAIPTQIPCTAVLPTRIKALRKQLPSHVQRLNDTAWQERAFHYLDGTKRRIQTRSVDNKLPEPMEVSAEVDFYEPFSSFGSESTYINAVSVDGVRIKNQYLASRLPSTSGLPDFWSFVAERNVELIIILQRPDHNDPTVCDVVPRESTLVPMPYIQIETKTSSDEEELFTVDKLLLTDTSGETARPQFVTVLTCNGWECGDKAKPPAVTALVSLWRASENIPRKAGLALVLCRDGVTGCGLYLAMSILLERMAVERECDVISAVRAVRRSRPEFVQEVEQFEHLYDAALNYFEYFQTYANFS